MGGFLFRLFYLLAGVAALKTVFAWGRTRGFPIRHDDGRIRFGHLVRNLTMAILVAPLLLLASGPFVMVAFHLGR